MRRTCLIVLALTLVPSVAIAGSADDTVERKHLYESVSALTGVPWTYLAAVDQYERTLTVANRRTRTPRAGLIAIDYAPETWAGTFNPDHQDTDPRMIKFFGGIGQDGDGDGRADRTNDRDVLFTTAKQILAFGTSYDDFRSAVWRTYHHSRAVDRATQFAQIYARYGTIQLDGHAFIMPLRTQYTYRSTWGASRGWGGARIHEGTDIFASYGVPVRSACYGIVENKGWNKYGGWRVGIRSIHNVYHYYAHLSGFSKGLHVGQVVAPGDVLGWTGSSGYGKPGTSGKFPPHLHYGLYRDYGLADWSFDPYPNLRRWEREEMKRARR